MKNRPKNVNDTAYNSELPFTKPKSPLSSINIFKGIISSVCCLINLIDNQKYEKIFVYIYI